MNTKTRKITMMALITALSLVMVALCRIPIVLFLEYEPKDVIITIGGFLFGPLFSMMTSLIVSIIEMFTLSDTGIIGAIMNFLSTVSFACTASYIYKKNRTMVGAILGFAAGTILMTTVMIVWNYLMTPYFMGVPREVVVGLLIPAILPFNLLKSGLNTALILLIYKPITKVLRAGHVIEPSESSIKKGNKIGYSLVALALLITCIFIVLVWRGII